MTRPGAVEDAYQAGHADGKALGPLTAAERRQVAAILAVHLPELLGQPDAARAGDAA